MHCYVANIFMLLRICENARVRVKIKKPAGCLQPHPVLWLLFFVLCKGCCLSLTILLVS
ncbi:hypothetical protein KL86DES1_10522 [uncultured Desulfovibrio sp.]|uniref:Uncharacterized protein n=1 Tax=uncultured Desulfovibrio sp. TaxID=167968 RepID=A0A212KZ92_9BACT|nr:hypothetical protein KL86DES1_10522 [uncultured Desulfovibrio sp.]VZH32396.1 conserved protein of unknown function [Desulfovibrio sp. 86]